jgi:hypothetical protein
VLTLVALRLCLGCHFLYEGVWKIGHSDFRYDDRWKPEGGEEFTAKPFLALAKGPVSGLFYAMLPDVNSRQRLKVVVDEKTHEKSIDGTPISERWDQVRQDFVAYYRPNDSSAAAAADAHAKLAANTPRSRRNAAGIECSNSAPKPTSGSGTSRGKSELMPTRSTVCSMVTRRNVICRRPVGIRSNGIA